jgi:hypothetical protein
MSKAMLAPNPPAYPLVNEMAVNVVHTQPLGWGSLNITEQAVEDYGIDLSQLQEPDTEILAHTTLPTCGFKLDMLLAGPQEIHVPRAISFAANAALYTGGARMTIGLTKDRDMSGLEVTSHELQRVERLLSPENTREFRIDYGDDIQQNSLAVHSSRIAHGLAGVSAQTAAGAYGNWKVRQDKAATIHDIKKTTAAIAGLLVAGDVMVAPEIPSTPVVLGANLLGVLLNGVAAVSYVRREMQPELMMQNGEAARRLGNRVHGDMHTLLCPGARERLPE